LRQVAAASLELYSPDGHWIVLRLPGQQGRDRVLATLSVLALSDAVLGFHSGFWFVYAAAAVAVVFGRISRDRGVGAIAGAALGSSLSFFLITNFMVWATTRIYPATLAGLAACFTAAIPFYQNQFLGDAFYTLAIFGGYALLKRSFHPAHQAA